MKKRLPFLTVRALFLAIGLAALIAIPAAIAGQLGVNIGETSGYKTFDYKIRTYDNAVKEITFKIRDHNLDELRGYVPDLKAPQIQDKMDKAIIAINSVNVGLREKHMEEVCKEIEKTLPSGVKIELDVKNNDFRYTLRYPHSMSQAEVDALKPAIQERLGMEWRAYNSQFSEDIEDRLDVQWDRIIGDDPLTYMITSQGQFYPALNYTQISKDFRREMRPLSDAIKKVSDPRNERTLINDTLSFFQAIPYNNFQTRNVKAGGSFGFAVPTALLEINEGDCDTKSTAMAATLMNMMPNRDVILLLLPKHALLGIYTPYKQPGDTTFKFRHREYVLMEPTSEGFPLGKIFPESAQHIQAGRIDKVMWLTR